MDYCLFLSEPMAAAASAGGKPGWKKKK